MTKTVTLPKTEFDFMERKLNEFEADFKEQVENEVAEHRDVYAKEINKLMAENFALSNSRKVLPVFVEDSERAKQFTCMYGENFNKYSANKLVYTHNRDAYLKLIKSNRNLQDEVYSLTQKLQSEKQYSKVVKDASDSWKEELDILKTRHSFISKVSLDLGATSILLLFLLLLVTYLNYFN